MDLGGEFDNGLFDEFAARRGITMEKVPRNSSAAQGHVERGNRTVVEGARTQLIEGDRPHATLTKFPLCNGFS